jgi:uncharacterized protein (DUF486 family)
MSTTGYKVATVLLLCGSCAVMTCAWYLHLKFKHWGMAKAIGFSWLLAGAEYCLMVPANRIGAQYAEMSPATLRGIAEVAILTSFLLFNRVVLKQDVLWNHVVGFGTVFVGVLVVRKLPGASNRGGGGEVITCRLCARSLGASLSWAQPCLKLHFRPRSVRLPGRRARSAYRARSQGLSTDHTRRQMGAQLRNEAIRRPGPVARRLPHPA